MSEIVLLSGSPSNPSRSDRVVSYLGELLEQENFSVSSVSVRDFSSEELFRGRYDSVAIQQLTALIQNAKGVIVGSPVYKGAYSGVLKALLDLLPQDVFQSTPVLPVMTGGGAGHLLALEYSLKPVLATLKAHNLKGLYFLDHQINKYQELPIVDEEILLRAKKQLNYFVEMIKRDTTLTAYSS
ncbi:NADPH-dependent FMN reductase [Virgibacillus sp. MSP4-1]|uniref:NADPH-dependent FMN reductase n=1 Tax=Virgibacillus sp. MSP4-1 TaxID=2700081 RepID=UPI00039D3A2A|nr:NADPH-dependent FMN reductase [Virgibacillus sp. MSP4-1]QHS21909.1 NADPH-dependent FMN reductase [Virgibacillus sp. MSP4-1]